MFTATIETEKDLNTEAAGEDLVNNFYSFFYDSNNNAPSGFSHKDQMNFDNTIYNNFDIVSTNILFKKLKNYEEKYKCESSLFYSKWIKNEVQSNFEIHDWMNIYKSLLN